MCCCCRSSQHPQLFSNLPLPVRSEPRVCCTQHTYRREPPVAQNLEHPRSISASASPAKIGGEVRQSNGACHTVGSKFSATEVFTARCSTHLVNLAPLHHVAAVYGLELEVSRHLQTYTGHVCVSWVRKNWTSHASDHLQREGNWQTTRYTFCRTLLLPQRNTERGDPKRSRDSYHVKCCARSTAGNLRATSSTSHGRIIESQGRYSYTCAPACCIRHVANQCHDKLDT